MSEINSHARQLSNSCALLEGSSSSKDNTDSNHNSNPRQPPLTPTAAAAHATTSVGETQRTEGPATSFSYPTQRKRSLQVFTGAAAAAGGAADGAASKGEEQGTLVRRAAAHLLSSISSGRPSRNTSIDYSAVGAPLAGRRQSDQGTNENSRLSITSDGGANLTCSTPLRDYSSLMKRNVSSQRGGESHADAATGTTTSSTNDCNNASNSNGNGNASTSQQDFTPLTHHGFDSTDQQTRPKAHRPPPLPAAGTYTLRTLLGRPTGEAIAEVAGKEGQAVRLRRTTNTRLALTYLRKFVAWSALPLSKMKDRTNYLLSSGDGGSPSTRGELGSLSWSQEPSSPLSTSTPAAGSPLQTGTTAVPAKRSKDLPQWTLVDCTKSGNPSTCATSQHLQRSRSLQSGDSGAAAAPVLSSKVLSIHQAHADLVSPSSNSPAGWLMSSTRSTSASTFDMGGTACVDLDSVVQVEAENRTRRVEKEERQRHRLEARATAALDELFRAALQQKLKAGLHPSLLSSSCPSDLIGPEESGSDEESLEHINQQLLERSQQLLERSQQGRCGSFASRSLDRHSLNRSFGASSTQLSPARSMQDVSSHPLSRHSTPSRTSSDTKRSRGLHIPLCLSLEPTEGSAFGNKPVPLVSEETTAPAPEVDLGESAASLSEGAPDSFSCTHRPVEEEDELAVLARRTYSSLMRHSETSSGGASPGETPHLGRLTPSSHVEMGSGHRISSSSTNNLGSTQKPSAALSAAIASVVMETASLPHAVFLLEVRRPERERRQSVTAEWLAGMQAIEEQFHATKF